MRFERRPGLLRTVPDSHDPDRLSAYSVEKSVRSDDYFTMGEIGELGQRAARFGEALEPAKSLSNAPTKADRCVGLVTTDIFESVEKLSAR